jgi:type IV pilus assembly protein PilE
MSRPRGPLSPPFTLSDFPLCRVMAAGGFSLIEVGVCLALIAILAAFAIPSYRAQLMRAYRVDAVSALYHAAQAVEQAQSDAAPGESIATLPAELAQAPPSGRAIYRLTLVGPTSANGGYALEARPLDKGPMQADSACGVFILDATGQRANQVGGVSTTERVGPCWDGLGALP